MFTGLKAYGETTKNHWAWGLIIILLLAFFGLNLLSTVRTTAMRIPVIGPMLSKFGTGTVVGGSVGTGVGGSI
jgi:hypothetical protein